MEEKTHVAVVLEYMNWLRTVKSGKTPFPLSKEESSSSLFMVPGCVMRCLFTYTNVSSLNMSQMCVIMHERVTPSVSPRTSISCTSAHVYLNAYACCLPRLPRLLEVEN